MSSIPLGIISGLIYGSFAALIMVPMKMGDKQKKIESIAGAFLERFMIGFLIPNTDLGVSYIFSGLIIGFGLSLPTAIITRAYAPIIGMGIVGGLIIGVIANSVL